jgi:hypothetical protein
MIKEELELPVSQQTVSKILADLNFTKKRRSNANLGGETEEDRTLREQYAKIYQN